MHHRAICYVQVSRRATSLRNCSILRNSITRLLDTTFSISRHVNKRFKLRNVYNFSFIYRAIQLSGIIIFVEKVNLNKSRNAKMLNRILTLSLVLMFLNLFPYKIYARRKCAAVF